MRQQRSKLSLRQKRLQKELYKTLAYSDIFSYPLTGKQLFHFLGVSIKGKDFFSLVQTLPHARIKQTTYYFLPNREDIVHERLKKEQISREKIIQTKKIARLLSLFPTIRFIGISGSLALLHADKKSDSDFFIITKSHTVWLTRFLVYSSLWLLGKKRTKNAPNKICANFFLDETALRMTKRNLYIAHEIAQVIPLVNKNQIFERFLHANKWILTYFPNMKLPAKIKSKRHVSLIFFSPLEYFLRVIQLWYMKNKITREILTSTLIAFHPIDYEKSILDAYEKRIKKLRK